MKTTLLTGLTLTLTLSLVGIASAQTYATGPVNNGWGWPGGYYGHASTAAEGYLRGTADVLRAAGDYNYNTSLGMINAQEAQRRYLENRKRYAQTYFDMRRINRDARAQERGPRPTTADLQRISRAKAPRPLTPDQYQPEFGLLNWPLALTSDAFAQERETIDRLIKLRGSVDGDEELVKTLAAEMQSKLKQDVRRMPPSQYTAAKRFLTGLQVEMDRTPALVSVASR